MILKYKKTSIALFIFDFVCFMAMWLINNPSLNPFLYIAFLISFVIGCRYLALAKGYNGVIGLLLGLTMALGLIVLLILPDRTPKAVLKS